MFWLSVAYFIATETPPKSKYSALFTTDICTFIHLVTALLNLNVLPGTCKFLASKDLHFESYNLNDRLLFSDLYQRKYENMADKNKKILSVDDKLALARELYAIGKQQYSQHSSMALAYFKTSSKLYRSIKGYLADELGEIYLLWARLLAFLVKTEDSEESDENDESEESDESDESDDGESSEPPAGALLLAFINENNAEDDGDLECEDKIVLIEKLLGYALEIFNRQGEPALMNLGETHFMFGEIFVMKNCFETAVLSYSKLSEHYFEIIEFSFIFLIQKMQKTSL